MRSYGLKHQKEMRSMDHFAARSPAIAAAVFTAIAAVAAHDAYEIITPETCQMTVRQGFLL